MTESQLDSIKNSLAATLNVSPSDISLTIKNTLKRETSTIVVAEIVASAEEAGDISDSLKDSSFETNFKAKLSMSGAGVDLNSVSTPTITNGN